MNNKGFEMALTWNDKVKDFQYNVAFNLSYYKNEVTELTEEIDVYKRQGLYRNLQQLRETEGQAPCNYFKAMGYDLSLIHI